MIIHVLAIAAATAVIMLITLLPFIPGSYDPLAAPLSMSEGVGKYPYLGATNLAVIVIKIGSPAALTVAASNCHCLTASMTGWFSHATDSTIRGSVTRPR